MVQNKALLVVLAIQAKFAEGGDLEEMQTLEDRPLGKVKCKEIAGPLVTLKTTKRTAKSDFPVLTLDPKSLSQLVDMLEDIKGFMTSIHRSNVHTNSVGRCSLGEIIAHNTNEACIIFAFFLL
jgi:hypothetical protein